jgi:hypothetical protein
MGCSKCQKSSKSTKSSPRSKSTKSRSSRRRSPRRERKGALRVVHNVPGAPNVDVYITPRRGGQRQRVLTNVAYKQASGYLEVPAASYVVEVTPTGSQDVLIRQSLRVLPESFNTAIAVGDVSDLSGLKLLVTEDDGSCSRNKKGKLRFIHGAAAIPAVDVVVDGQKVLTNVEFGDVSSYLKLSAPEVYNVEVLLSSNQQRALQTMVVLENRQNLSILASGIPGSDDTPVTAIPLVDNDQMCVCVV